MPPKESIMPHDLEAERALLGCLLMDAQAIDEVAPLLDASDFYRPLHVDIYKHMCRLHDAGELVDTITLYHALHDGLKDQDESLLSYLIGLTNAEVFSLVGAEEYARRVSQDARRRKLIRFGTHVVADAHADSDADATLEKAEAGLFEIAKRGQLAEWATLSEVAADYFDRFTLLQQQRGQVGGVPTGFRALDFYLGGLSPKDMVVVAGRPGTGKCLTARTLLDDPLTGERVTIEEYVRRRTPVVYGLSETGNIRPTAVSDWVDSGVQPCYRVQTRLGRMVEVTGHHPFLTIHGWKPLHDLQVGDSIAVPSRIECFGTDEGVPLEMVRLLAYFIAEGGLTRISPAFTNADPVIIEDFKRSIASHFPTCAIRQEYMTYTVAQPRNEVTQRGGAVLPKNPVTMWLKELGLMGKYAKEKFFPPCVWKWSRRYLAEFLRVLMSCDGSIFPGSKGYPTIQFTVASMQLASDVAHAFLRFGIISKYYQTSRGAYRVDITNSESVRNYQEQIGWIGEKASRFSDWMPPTGKLCAGNVGHAPCDVWPLLRASLQQQGISFIEMARRSGETTKTGHANGYNPHARRSLPRYRLAAYAEVLDDSNLRRASSPDVFWDEIVSIESIGAHQVYDLTVPDGANFVAQDVFVHNSSFALSIAYNASFKHQKKIAIFSLEMSRDELFGRLLSMRARVDGQRLRMPWLLGADELERIEQAKGDLCSDHLYIDETPSLNTTLLRSKARRLRAKEGIDLVIIDYLQLMEAYVDGKRIRERHLEVAEISKAIKSLAKELEVPILALAQLNRDVESRASKVPQLSDLKECVVGSTRLIDAKTGKWVPIAEIQPEDEVLGLGEQQTIERFAVQDVWRTGTKPVFCLTTRTGRQLIATANHPLLTPAGWKRLGELALGDCIATALRLPGHGHELPDRADLCRLLGYLVGDGTYLKHCGVGFISSDPETYEDVLCIVATHFPAVTPRQVKRKGRAQEVYFTCLYENGYGKPYGNPLREWLRTLELVGQRDNTKHVPAWVFEAGAVGAREFLAGYLSADGCVKVETRRGHTTWRIHFETVSHRLACDIQALLLRIGVVSTINDGSFNTKSTQLIYRVGVSTCADNLKRFAEQVPARGKKGRALQQLLQELPDERTNPGVFGLPVEVSAYLAAHAQWRDQGKCMRRDVCLEWAERLDDPVLREWGMSDLLWEEIRRIEPCGEAEVFDICIPKCHNFLANGIVAHNSGQIEQDCDAVLFLYSEEMHNPNTERKGQVDVIIAKHRHGPIGEVALHFEKRYTQFSNLEVKR